MCRYPILFFDNDDTLMDFHAAEAQALQRTFAAHAIPLDQETQQLYQSINRRLWREFEEGLVTKEQLLDARFSQLFEQQGIREDGRAFNREYLYNLGYGTQLMPQALETCQTLSRRGCRLYLLTNGVTDTQKRRLAASALAPYISGVFVSEETGFQKPLRGFFDYVFQRVEDFHPSRTLMVGDSLTSDIAGAQAAGLDTCWYTPQGGTAPGPVYPTHQITSLTQLEPLIFP